MVSKHQGTIKNAITQLEKVRVELEKLKEVLQAEYDNLPFETQESEYGVELQFCGDLVSRLLIKNSVYLLYDS